MIFNPLFFSEQGNSQVLAPKSNKLSNNKYLFSDIVKIVMNPISDESKINNKNIIGSAFQVSENLNSKIENLKLQYFSELEEDNAELGLIKILPQEIRDLLKAENIELSDQEIISYISQEPINAEIQAFINELVGKDFVEKSLTKNSGLLVSLEDQKSTVNLELVKDTNKNSNNKIIVQTLVVPQKSKLFSLVNNLSSIKGNTLNPSQSEQNVDIKSLGSQNSNIPKPLLSVYSFNYKQTSEAINASGNKFIHDKLLRLNILKGNELKELNSELKKTDIGKISFIPKKMLEGEKNINTSDLVNQNEKGIKISENNLKVLDLTKPQSAKEFNVSKITIVKKEIPTNNEEGQTAIGKLKRVDFAKSSLTDDNKLVTLSKSKNLQNLKFTNISNEIKSSTPHNISKDNLNLTSLKVNKLDGEIVSKTGDASKLTESNKTIKNEVPESTLKVVKETILLNGDQKLNEKYIKIEKGPANIKSDADTKIKSEDGVQIKKEDGIKINKSVVEKISVEKLESKINENRNNANINPNEQRSTKSDGTIESAPKDTIKNSTIPESKSENIKIQTPSLEKNSNADKDTELQNKQKPDLISKTEKNNVGKEEQNQVSKFKVDNNSSNKDTIEQKERTVNESKQNDPDQRHFKDTDNKTNDVETKKIEQIKTAQIINTVQDVDLSDTKENKKISVKIKSNVKTVQNKNEAINSDQQTNQNNGFNSSEDYEQNEKSNEQNLNKTVLNLHGKNHFEQTLQHTLTKEDPLSQNVHIDKAFETDQNTNQRVIKSVEIIREISRFISKQERGSISFDIKPEHLGKMKITLDSTDHVLKARIDVDNEHARQLIERNLDKLHHELSENGIKLSSLNISLGNPKQHKADKGVGNKKQTYSENLGQVGETMEEEKKKSFGYNTYEYIA